jgi:hypothetical protein
MENTEPVTDLILNAEDGPGCYHVRVPIRINDEIGDQYIGTFQQFIDAIETRGQYSELVVTYIDGDEMEAWKAADAKLTAR